MYSRANTLQFDERNGVYFTRLQSNGYRKYFALGKIQKLADRKLRNLCKQQALGTLLICPQPTTQCLNNSKKDIAVEELAYKHLTWCQNNLAVATYAVRKNFIKQFLGFLKLLPSPKIFWVSEVTRQIIEDYYSWAKNKPHRSPNSGNEHLRHIKTMLRWGEDQELYTLPVRYFPKTKSHPPLTRNFTDEEIFKLVAVLDGDFKDMILFGFYTGLRPHELRLLRKDQVRKDINNGYLVNIEDHKTSVMGKSHKPRSVPLTPETIEIYERQIRQHPDSDYVFITARGLPYPASTLRNKLKRKCKRAKIDPKLPYGLRHTVATIQSGSGITESVGRAILGQSKPETYARYSSNNQPYHQHAAQVVADHLKRIMEGAKQETSDRESDRELKMRKGKSVTESNDIRGFDASI